MKPAREAVEVIDALLDAAYPRPAPLARPVGCDTPAPRRGDLLPTERVDLVFMLTDYAELLESFAVGVDDDGPIDRDTRERAARARDFANRFK